MAYTSPSLAAMLAQASSFNALLLLSFVASLLALSYYVSLRFKSQLLRSRPPPPSIPPPPHAPPLIARAGGWDALLDHQRGIGRYAYKHMVYAERRWLADLARQRKVDAVCF